MPSLDEYVGQKLRALRVSRAVEPDKVAAYLSISLERYAALELGRKPISARHLFDLSAFFDMPITYFFAGHMSEDSAQSSSPSTSSGHSDGSASN